MLKKFKCTKCRTTCLVNGGTTGFRCVSCRGNDYTSTAQYKAHQLVARAIKDGALQRPETKPCTDCGGRATEYDHRDYSKPLDVQPVCRGCNARRGPAISNRTGDHWALYDARTKPQEATASS
jgi:hypothetical protein